MRGILILYLTKTFIEGGLGINEQSASLIYGFFTGFVYFTPLIGGWLADRFLGQRNAITIGGLTMMDRTIRDISLSLTPILLTAT